MLGLKLNHVSKGGPWAYVIPVVALHTRLQLNTSTFQSLHDTGRIVYQHSNHISLHFVWHGAPIPLWSIFCLQRRQPVSVPGVERPRGITPITWKYGTICHCNGLVISMSYLKKDDALELRLSSINPSIHMYGVQLKPSDNISEVLAYDTP